MVATRRCEPAQAAHPPLGPAQIEAVAALFGVLAEPTRLRLVQALQEGPASVGDLVDRLDLGQANASKQLSRLHRAGILSRTPKGQKVEYAIAMPLVFELCALVCGRLDDMPGS